ncbi:hypothetical protein JW930_02140 [Candidatus Woesearchaeota archaeon]|nr:hypothetical protein [Candidatus Woesearchaeota archaeon]
MKKEPLEISEDRLKKIEEDLEKKEYDFMTIFLFVVGTILIASMFVLIQNPFFLSWFHRNKTIELPMPTTLQTTSTTLQERAFNPSFREFLDNPNKYLNTKITVYGKLMLRSRGTDPLAISEPITIDRYNNRITLREVKEEQYHLFPKNVETKDYYKIEGLFIQSTAGYIIVVENLELAG